MKTMYPAQVNSPGTELATAIDATQDTILVADGSMLLDGPNLLTIGTDEAAETILYTGKSGDELTGVTRGFQGSAQSWAVGTKVARYFTAYDHDAAIGNISELSDGLTATRDRLDTEQHKDVVLAPGMHVVNAERSAPFKLSGIKGRTLVNLAGRQTNRTVNDTASATISVGLGSTGSNTEVINVDVKDSGEAYLVFNQAGGTTPFKATAGKYYAVVADVKINSISGAGLIKLGGSGLPAVGAVAVDKTKLGVWQRVAHRFTMTADTEYSIIVGTCYAGTVLAKANFDVRNIALHEISQSDYDSLQSLSEAQVSAKYPYVDSVQPVRNPYAIRYGENLLPPFYEWASNYVNTQWTILEPYTARLTPPNGSTPVSMHYDITLTPNAKYTISAEQTDGATFSVIDMARVTALVDNTTKSTMFTTGNSGTVRIFISSYLDGGAIGKDSYTFKNLMLTLGTKAKPFKPREDSMLALQTDLYSDPLTGTNADEVFEKDGQYFKLVWWKKATITDNFNYVGIGGKGVGWKQTFFDLPSNTSGPYSETVIKYDGKILQSNQITNSPDSSAIDSGNAKRCYISIANTDSGWGDNYTPTADEIKAYFMGWKMYNPDTNPNGDGVYNDSGRKFFAYRRDGVSASYTGGQASFPTTVAPNWTPYQLVYQLATPTVEPIVSEGILTFNEGDNQIEVGTGIVLRENVKPIFGNGYYRFNDTALAGTTLKYKLSKPLFMYRNSQVDYGWEFISDQYAYGTYKARKAPAQYDASASDSITYMMLDTSPAAPFTGSYAANEKAMLQELTDAVQQNATAVSVLMNKKAEKDAPGLIMPTLLNGITFNDTSVNNNGYYKDSNGRVWLSFAIVGPSSGPIPQGTTIFKLVDGFRPRKREYIAGVTTDGMASSAQPISVRIEPDGAVILTAVVGTSSWLSVTFSGSFLAR
ncbi:hypothetical protein [Paenibacillus solani]|uniref:hypothetical protein n=1 Tax=Paenibacillus solani TaxID=1705565 RepID=UPI003D2A716D